MPIEEYSFSNERMFFRKFFGEKMSRPRGELIRRTFRFMPNALPFELPWLVMSYSLFSSTGSGGRDIFVCKVNIWNVNLAQHFVRITNGCSWKSVLIMLCRFVKTIPHHTSPLTTFSSIMIKCVPDRVAAIRPLHDDVIKWKHFPRYWPFVRGIHQSPMNSPHKGQWRGVWCFLRSAPEQTSEQIIETPVIWDATVLIMT